MTKNTKIIIGIVLGLLLIGGFIFVGAIALIGISIMAAQASDDTTPKNKPSISRNGSNQTKKSQNSSNDSDEDAAEISGSFSPELVGKWNRSEGSGHVDYTGKTQYKSGADFTYEFSADGTVKYSMDKDVLSILQCKIAENKSATGKAASDGETLTVSLGKMNHTSSNSCEAADNFEKTLPAETIKLKYRLKTEYEETQLCIEENDGERCYQRKE